MRERKLKIAVLMDLKKEEGTMNHRIQTTPETGKDKEIDFLPASPEGTHTS